LVEDSRFDELSRILAQGMPRRRILAVLAGAALATLRAGRAGASSCREAGRICREDANCCSGLCGAKDASGRRTCACPSDTETCRGACVTADVFLADPLNCGACNHRCPGIANGTAICTDGACGVVCNEGFRPCDSGLCAPADGCCTDDECPGFWDTCGGGGTPGVCGCTPRTCETEARQCDTVPDFCGGELTCGLPACGSGSCCAGCCYDNTLVGILLCLDRQNALLEGENPFC
jgi:hypothetical protein